MPLRNLSTTELCFFSCNHCSSTLTIFQRGKSKLVQLKYNDIAFQALFAFYYYFLYFTFFEVTSPLHFTALPSTVSSLSCGKAFSEFSSSQMHFSGAWNSRQQTQHVKASSLRKCVIVEVKSFLTCWLKVNWVQRAMIANSLMLNQGKRLQTESERDCSNGFEWLKTLPMSSTRE